MNLAALAGGIAVLLLAWVLFPWSAGGTSFTAHMLAHMGVIAIAAPLIAIGVAGGRFDASAVVPTLFSPVPASLLDLAVVWFWHVPAMRGLAEASVAAAFAEQMSFLAAGLVLWLACLGQGSSSPQERYAAGAFGLLFTSVHMTLLGALLALTPRPLYRFGEATCFGVTLSAEQDQQVGGVVMLLVGAAVYLAGGIALLAQVLNRTESARSTMR